MIAQRSSLYLLTALLMSTSLVMGLGESAQAGFSWEPPGKTGGIKNGPAVPPPPAPLRAEPLQPQERSTAPMEKAQSSILQAPQQIESYPAGKSDITNVVQGFGSDMPLAYALRQIVPARFGYSFGSGVNAGARVSWEGGQPWPAVVQTMLQPIGLTSRISGQVLVIEQGTTIVTPMAAPVAPPVLIPATPAAKPLPPKPATPASASAPPQNLSGMPSAQDMRRHVIKDPGNGPAMLVVPMADAGPAVITPPVVSPQAVTMWQAQKGQSLRAVITDWAKQDGTGVQWNLPVDIALNSDVVVSGDFTTAVRTIFAKASGTGPAPTLRLISGPPGGPASVLVVEPGK